MIRDKAIKWLICLSALSCLIWMGGLAWTLQETFSGASAAPLTGTAPAEEQTPEPAADDGSFRLLALGDSLTRGAGDPEGKGYVGYLQENMKEKSGRDIALTNYGVNGQIASQLAEQLGQSKTKNEVKTADVIVLSIGGNDLFQGGQTLGNLEQANISTIEEAYLLQLDSILKQLRENNADARIFLIGLYNPFGSLDNAAATTRIVREWNYKAAEVAAAYPQTVLVPTADLFQLQVQDYLARDLFHPNAAGYRLIGERVASLITWEGVKG
ncbi:GDSL-type esterase/lipase family protein [Paenibacillus nasutitermitis]|uniref:SGNH hydrolase-type esterase domain-containing protein n=1 Tax=Paenibacillus nasutitermitis TaxID=1652958 RepID=A0A916ZDP7_9BACL|nr:GDSL-type esterase/lipase family protein [Paenibacillus nasutitermitis]GGD90824.1 hypothetical protein GCM10010911_56910 [Paenibacillus nasutitermitis]